MLPLEETASAMPTAPAENKETDRGKRETEKKCTFLAVRRALLNLERQAFRIIETEH